MYFYQLIKKCVGVAIVFGAMQSAHATGSGDIGSGTIDPMLASIKDHVDSFICKGQFRGGYGVVTVASLGADQFSLLIEFPEFPTEKPIKDTFKLEKMNMNLSRIEIAGFRVSDDASDKTGLFITIPLAEGKARIWKVWDGLEERHIYDHIDEENTTYCTINPKAK